MEMEELIEKYENLLKEVTEMQREGVCVFLCTIHSMLDIEFRKHLSAELIGMPINLIAKTKFENSTDIEVAIKGFDGVWHDYDYDSRIEFINYVIDRLKKEL